MALELVKKAPTDQSKDSSLIIRSHILEGKKKKKNNATNYSLTSTSVFLHAQPISK